MNYRYLMRNARIMYSNVKTESASQRTTEKLEPATAKRNIKHLYRSVYFTFSISMLFFNVLYIFFSFHSVGVENEAVKQCTK